MSELFEQPGGAAFSACRKYRFALWRIWDKEKPLVMFIGLNPSKADETEPDNTIKSVTRISKNLGYGGFYMMNCFPYVSTNPEDLKEFGNTDENEQWLDKVAESCKDVIFAWGNFEVVKNRAAELVKKFPNGMALIINKDGSPRHPLYVKSSVTPVKFSAI